MEGRAPGWLIHSGVYHQVVTHQP